MTASDDVTIGSHRTGAFHSDESGSRRSDVDRLETRLAAVERAITDGDTPVADLDDAAALDQRLDAVETAVADLEDRIAGLESASRALRGYAGGIRAVNENVERRADLALSKVETIERSLCQDPGLQIERLDVDAAGPSGSDTGPAGEHLAGSDPSTVGDTSAAADTSHASDTDVATAIESTGTPESTDDAESVSETEPSTGDACRSLSTRIRDAL